MCVNVLVCCGVCVRVCTCVFLSLSLAISLSFYTVSMSMVPSSRAVLYKFTHVARHTERHTHAHHTQTHAAGTHTHTHQQKTTCNPTTDSVVCAPRLRPLLVTPAPLCAHVLVYWYAIAGCEICDPYSDSSACCALAPAEP